jgi:hypothetical protein
MTWQNSKELGSRRSCYRLGADSQSTDHELMLGQQLDTGSAALERGSDHASTFLVTLLLAALANFLMTRSRLSLER